ncbi:MAG: hypothetical protein ACMG57_02840 [Candidatus Dojkabacteria bacterium]
MKKRLKATSLVEVLIVLAIISSTILGSMLLVSNSFVVVRQNQTEDYVNGLVVNAMEIIKSPSNISVTDNSFVTTQNPTPVYFKLTRINGSAYLEKTQDDQITTCTAGSQYIISAASLSDTSNTTAGATDTTAGATDTTANIPGTTTPNVCVQVKIVPVTGSILTNGIQSYYQMTVIAVYNSQDNNPIIVNFQSNRYEAFNQVAK